MVAGTQKPGLVLYLKDFGGWKSAKHILKIFKGMSYWILHKSSESDMLVAWEGMLKFPCCGVTVWTPAVPSCAGPTAQQVYDLSWWKQQEPLTPSPAGVKRVHMCALPAGLPSDGSWAQHRAASPPKNAFSEADEKSDALCDFCAHPEGAFCAWLACLLSRQRWGGGCGSLTSARYVLPAPSVEQQLSSTPHSGFR